MHQMNEVLAERCTFWQALLQGVNFENAVLARSIFEHSASDGARFEVPTLRELGDCRQVRNYVSPQPEMIEGRQRQASELVALASRHSNTALCDPKSLHQFHALRLLHHPPSRCMIRPANTLSEVNAKRE